MLVMIITNLAILSRMANFPKGIKEVFPWLHTLWLKYESLDKSGSFPDPDILAQEIIDDLEAALERSREISADKVGKVSEPSQSSHIAMQTEAARANGLITNDQKYYAAIFVASQVIP